MHSCSDHILPSFFLQLPNYLFSHKERFQQSNVKNEILTIFNNNLFVFKIRIVVILSLIFKIFYICVPALWLKPHTKNTPRLMKKPTLLLPVFQTWSLFTGGIAGAAWHRKTINPTHHPTTIIFVLNFCPLLFLPLLYCR